MFLVLAGPYAGYLESSEGYRDNFLLAAIMAILMSCLYMCTFLLYEENINKICGQNVFCWHYYIEYNYAVRIRSSYYFVFHIMPNYILPNVFPS